MASTPPSSPGTRKRRSSGTQQGQSGSSKVRKTGGGSGDSCAGNAPDPPLGDPGHYSVSINPSFYTLRMGPDSANDMRQIQKLELREDDYDSDPLSVVLVQTPLENYTYWPHKGKGAYEGEERIIITLVVGVGSADDPLDYPGMAHFVEHLYVSRVHPWARLPGYEFGGVTGEEMTYYTMTIPKSAGKISIRVAVGMEFRRFNLNVGDLRYSAAGIESQVNSIHQEYELKRGATDLRLKEVMRRILHPQGSTLRNFTHGNRPSMGLANKNFSSEEMSKLRTALSKWVATHYNAENYVVVIQGVGDFELSDLEDLAKKIYRKMVLDLDPQIPQTVTGTSNRLDWPEKLKKGDIDALVKRAMKADCPSFKDGPSFSLDQVAFNKIYYVRPTDYSNQIYLSWYIDYTGPECRARHARTNPLLYIEALLHNCKGKSLVASLRKRKLIWALRTTKHQRCNYTWADEYFGVSLIPWSRRTNAFIFVITLELTKEGSNNAYDVICAVMQYIKELKAVPEAYDTIQRLRRAQIRTFGAFRKPGMTNAKIGCSVLFPEGWNENSLTDDITLHGYDKEEIERVLTIMKTPSKLNVVMMAHLRDKDLNEFTRLDFEDPHGEHDFDVRAREILQKEIDEWSRKGLCQGPSQGQHDPSIRTTETETNKTPEFQMPTSDDIDPSADRREWERLCNDYCSAFCDLGGENYLARDYDKSHGSDMYKDHRGRRLFIRAAKFHVPYSTVTIQIWQPNYLVRSAKAPEDPNKPVYSKDPNPRAIRKLLAEMINIRTSLEQSTWAQSECCVLKSKASISDFRITIQGLHHLVKKLLLEIFSWLTDVGKAFEGLKEMIFEAAKINLLRTIYDNRFLCEDLTLRGTMIGYDAAIESYDFLRELESAQDLDLYLKTFLEEMEITTFVRTNVPRGFEDSLTIEAFTALPPYVPRPPPPNKSKNVELFYKMAVVKDELGAYLESPNAGSRLNCIRNTYQFEYTGQDEVRFGRRALEKIMDSAEGKMKQLVVNAGVSYSPTVALGPLANEKRSKIATLYMEIPSDIRTNSLDQLDELLDRIAGLVKEEVGNLTDRNPVTLVAKKLVKKLVRPSELDPSTGDLAPTGMRLYQVRVRGHEKPTDRGVYPPKPDYSSMKVRKGYGSAYVAGDKQKEQLTKSGNSNPFLLGNDLAKSIPPKTS